MMLRRAHLAGQWYPGGATECTLAVKAHAADTSPEQGAWRGIIAPHAGWRYSGDTAARTYRWLADAQPSVDLVVLFAGHLGRHESSTVCVDEGWQTPLGPLMTPISWAHQVATACGIEAAECPASSAADNAVELHLPLIRHFFPEAELLHLGVAPTPEAVDLGTQVGRLAKEAGRQAVFVGSTDLTHYGPAYGFEPEGPADQGGLLWAQESNDQQFLDRVLSGDASAVVAHGVQQQSACCPGAVGAAMAAVMHYGDFNPRIVEGTSSYDVHASPSFVGYAGLVL